MVRVLFLFLTRFHVSVARSNGNQQGAKIFPPKINAGNLLPQIRSTAQIWIVSGHQHGIPAVAPQTSSRGKPVVGFAVFSG